MAWCGCDYPTVQSRSWVPVIALSTEANFVVRRFAQEFNPPPPQTLTLIEISGILEHINNLWKIKHISRTSFLDDSEKCLRKITHLYNSATYSKPVVVAGNATTAGYMRSIVFFFLSCTGASRVGLRELDISGEKLDMPAANPAAMSVDTRHQGALNQHQKNHICLSPNIGIWTGPRL